MLFECSCYGSLKPVIAGAKRLAQLILGASHVTQAVIPALLAPTTPETRATLGKWKFNLNCTLAQQAQFLCQELASCPGLQVVAPQGAMYAMIRIMPVEYPPLKDWTLQLEQPILTTAGPPSTNIWTDVQFCKLLLDEENVLVLPGSAFGATEGNLVRVVFCAPEPIMREAMLRVKRFCQRHFSPRGGANKGLPL